MVATFFDGSKQDLRKESPYIQIWKNECGNKALLLVSFLHDSVFIVLKTG